MPAAAQETLQKVDIDWNKTVIVSKSTPTLQVVTNPMLNPGSPIHDGSFSALKALGADYVRYVPWLPYPKIAVAELEPPTKDKTSWDFTYIDPVTKDFLAATEGHSTIINFSTIPAWMFKTDQPVKYPDDPNQVFWKYTQGTELRDPTGKELGDYFGRLVSWYTKGGFTDENGKRHESGYHYTFPIWEVLNEIDFEHNTTPEDYTKRYDAIVEGIRKVSPNTQFMGLALAAPGANPKYFEYFLNPRITSRAFRSTTSHSTSMPRPPWTRASTTGSTPSSTRPTASSPSRATSWPSATASRRTPRSTPMSWESFCPLTAGNPRLQSPAGPHPASLLECRRRAVRLSVCGTVEAGRRRHRRVATGRLSFAVPQRVHDRLQQRQTQRALSGCSSSSRTTSTPATNWSPKRPKPEDDDAPSDVLVQGFITPQGKKVLLVNKTNSEKTVELAQDLQNASTLTVDEATGDEAPRAGKAEGANLRLAPFAVTVLSVQ